MPLQKSKLCGRKIIVATVTPIQRCTLWKTPSSHLTDGNGGCECVMWAFLVPSQGGLQYLLWVGLKAWTMCQSILIIWTCPSPHCKNAGLVHAPRAAVNIAFSVTFLNRTVRKALCVSKLIDFYASLQSICLFLNPSFPQLLLYRHCIPPPPPSGKKLLMIAPP